MSDKETIAELEERIARLEEFARWVAEAAYRSPIYWGSPPENVRPILTAKEAA